MSRIIIVCAPLLIAATVSDEAQNKDIRVVEAKKLFDKYVSLGQKYDAKLADLYDDDAEINNLRKYPDGRMRKMSLTGKQYKGLIRLSMPLAKARGDKSQFSEVTYTIEEDGIRIKASRYSELKKYSSPMQWLVRPTGKGIWLIVEESSESMP